MLQVVHCCVTAFECMHDKIIINATIARIKQKNLTQMLRFPASFLYHSHYTPDHLPEENGNEVFQLDQMNGPADAAPCPQPALETDASE